VFLFLPTMQVIERESKHKAIYFSLQFNTLQQESYVPCTLSLISAYACRQVHTRARLFSLNYDMFNEKIWIDFITSLAMGKHSKILVLKR
jgi:hypothetical protein